MEKPAGKTLFGKLFSFLADAQEGNGTDSAAAVQDVGHAKAGHQGGSRFEERLKEVLAQHPTAVGGRVNLLNLSKLAERYGPRWPQLAEKVDQLIRITLSRRLSPRDFFTRAADGVYVVMFDGLSESEARLKCAMLADELASKLFGDAAMDAIDVCSAAAEVDGSIVLKSVSAAAALEEVLGRAEQYSARQSRLQDTGQAPALPDAADIAALLGAVEQELKARALGGGPASAAAPGVEPSNRLESLLELLRQTEQTLMQRMPQALQPAPPAATDRPAEPERSGPVLVPIAPPERRAGAARPEALALLDSVRQLIQRAEDALKTSAVGFAAQPMTEDELMAADLTFLYRPMWHVPHRVINAHLCQPAARLGRQYAVGDALLPKGADSQLAALLDRVVLRKTVEDAHEMLDSGAKGVLIVPVHHSTLTGSRARRDYLAVCNAIQPVLAKYLVWEILEPVSSMSASQLAPAVAALKALGRAVLVRIDIDHPRFEDFFGIGIHSVGTDVEHCSIPEAELIRKLELFRARAERYGLRCHVHGLRSTSLLAAAICGGYDYVDGDGVVGATDHPRGVSSFSLGDLYRHLYPEALPA